MSLCIKARSLEVMSDGKPRTSLQIAEILEPGSSSTRKAQLSYKITCAMELCEKWGQVERVGQEKVVHGRYVPWAIVWRAVQ